MNLIQRAKFAAGAGGHLQPTQFSDNFGTPHSSHPVIQQAVVEVNSVRLHSKLPESAAEAANINRKLEEVCGERA